MLKNEKLHFLQISKTFYFLFYFDVESNVFGRDRSFKVLVHEAVLVDGWGSFYDGSFNEAIK